jgi:glycosyltransferase involved in cell wall biosynthesis
VSSTTPELLFVGSVIPAKGIEVLLKSFKRTLSAFPKARLHIAGAYDDKYFNTLKPMISSSSMDDKVFFHGFCSLSKLIPLFAQASLLVLPSLMETAPNVVAEALVAGVPLVASAVGGIPEMLAQGASGVLVQPGSEESLAEGIAQVLSDPDRAMAVAAVAKEKALRDFDIEIETNELVDVYQQVIA